MARKKVAQMREDYSRQLEREEEERRLKDQERQARLQHEKIRCENPTSKVSDYRQCCTPGQVI
jgi:hypothetical protein